MGCVSFVVANMCIEFGLLFFHTRDLDITRKEHLVCFVYVRGPPFIDDFLK